MIRNNIVLLALFFVFSGCLCNMHAQGTPFLKASFMAPLLPEEEYKANLSMSHGHCQLPMEARFSDVNIRHGNSRGEHVKIDFTLNTASLVAAIDEPEKWTSSIQSASSFDVKKHPQMHFKCTDSYRLGDDWYHLKGMMTIKGTTKPAVFRVRLVQQPVKGGPASRKYVLNGEVALDDFGVSGGRVDGEAVRAYTLFMNMVVKGDGC